MQNSNRMKLRHNNARCPRCTVDTLARANCSRKRHGCVVGVLAVPQAVPAGCARMRIKLKTFPRTNYGVNPEMLSLSAETRAMLNLLACELFGQKMEIDASKVDWQRVLAEANRHVLTAFLYPGLKRLNGVPEEILSRARNAAMLSAARMEESLRAQDGILHYQRVGQLETAEIIVNRSEHIIVEPLASGKHTEVNPMGFTIVVEENGHNPNHSYYDIK